MRKTSKVRRRELDLTIKIRRGIAGGKEALDQASVPSHEAGKARLKNVQAQRQHHLCAKGLIANPDDIRKALRAGRWSELAVLKHCISDCLPVPPGSRLSAEMKGLFKQTAHLHNTGVYVRVLEALADKNNDASAQALLRGLQLRDKMAADEGGAISLRKVSKLLRISSGQVLRRARVYRLVAWRDWREEQLINR